MRVGECVVLVRANVACLTCCAVSLPRRMQFDLVNALCSVASMCAVSATQFRDEVFADADRARAREKERKKERRREGKTAEMQTENDGKLTYACLSCSSQPVGAGTRAFSTGFCMFC